MSDLTKAKAKLDALYAEWREAIRTLSDDRNQIAGKIYDQHKAVYALIDQQERREYAAAWTERWAQ